MEQIQHSLEHDRAKLVRRTQLNRSGVAPHGEPLPPPSSEPKVEEELFDDGEFYSALLKAFLDGSGAAASSASRGLLTRDRRQKQHRVRGGAARLSLAIQDKLLNFMAPTATNVLPPMADALFSSLFGQT
jgi:hypothetical protein